MLLIRNLKLGLSTALCALVLAACGGGGDDAPATPAALLAEISAFAAPALTPLGSRVIEAKQ